MLNVSLTRKFHVSTSGDLEAHLDDVMNALLALEGPDLMDADISATLAKGEVSISIIAISEASDEGLAFDEATATADSAIRAAIHAANGHTPEWVPVSQHAESLLPA